MVIVIIVTSPTRNPMTLLLSYINHNMFKLNLNSIKLKLNSLTKYSVLSNMFIHPSYMSFDFSFVAYIIEIVCNYIFTYDMD